MSDLISRADAIKAIDDLPNCYNGYSDTYDKSYIIGTLEEVPTADAVVVVRCKDCRWSYPAMGGTYCSYGVCVDCVVDEDFFCADGERGTDDE